MFNAILDLLFPKEVDISAIESMSLSDITLHIPVADELGTSAYKALFQYRDKVMRKAVWEMKYANNKIITKKFSELLYELILETASLEMSFSNFKDPMVIPIPSSKNALKERGFNQSESIAKEIIYFDGGKNLKLCLDGLKKVKETKHQSKLKNRNERLNNLKGCFYADPEKVRGKNIILIDDVITTGTTMKEASDTLLKAGAKKVIGFAMAH
ncbi:MAG: phosphoribosyltransferase family protein [archaeon]